MSREPPRRLIFLAGGDRRGRLAGHVLPGHRYQDHPFLCRFFADHLLVLEEFARALEWLRARLKRSPRCRIIVYPLLLLLIAAAGFIIVTSLIKFSTTLTFSYD